MPRRRDRQSRRSGHGDQLYGRVVSRRRPLEKLLKLLEDGSGETMGIGL
jgi:hypothetical protein